MEEQKLTTTQIENVKCWAKTGMDEDFLYYMLRCCKKLLDVTTESLEDLFLDTTGSTLKQISCPYCKSTLPDFILADLVILYRHFKPETRVCMYCFKDINEWGITLVCQHSICQRCIQRKVQRSTKAPIDAKGYCRFCCKFGRIGEIFNGNCVVQSNDSPLVSQPGVIENARGLVIPEKLVEDLVDPLGKSIEIIKAFGKLS